MLRSPRDGAGGLGCVTSGWREGGQGGGMSMRGRESEKEGGRSEKEIGRLQCLRERTRDGVIVRVK